MGDNSFFFGIPQSKTNANLIVIGLPWFKSSSYRICDINGPKAIREATSSKIYNPYTEDLIDLTKKYKIIDYGDLYPNDTDFIEYGDKVLEIIKEIKRDNERYLFLGGDHSITILTVKAMREHIGEFGLIYFDAHPDMYSKYDGNPYSHACTLRRIIDNDLVHPDNILIIGIRAPTIQQLDYIKENNVKFVTTKSIYKKGVEKLTSGALRELSHVDRLYVSIDLDVLDPAYAPGVGNPEPGGLSTRTLIEIIQKLKSFKVIAFDVVEYCKDFDYSNITSFASSKVIREMLGVMALSLD